MPLVETTWWMPLVHAGEMEGMMPDVIVTGWEGYRPSCFAWQAVRGDYEPGCSIGHGQTEQDAINDLVEQEELAASPSRHKDAQEGE